jgi:hypothetical protein
MNFISDFYVLLTAPLEICVWWNQPDALFILSLLIHYTSTCFGLAGSPSSGDSNVYMWQLVPPDVGLLANPKHEEVWWLNKLMINSASNWFHYTHSYLRSLLFWDVAHFLLVDRCRRFGTTYRSHIYGSSRRKTANISLHCGRSLTSRKPGNNRRGKYRELVPVNVGLMGCDAL